MDKITFGTLQKIKHEVLCMEIGRLNFNIMAKEFIAKILNVNPYKFDFETLINKCNENYLLKIDFKYNDENDFYIKFCNNKLDIRDSPIDAYFFIRNKVVTKINEIELRIVRLNNLKATLKNFVPELKDIENYKKNYTLITFYINKNKNALKDLKDFLVFNIENAARAMGNRGIITRQLENAIFFFPLIPHENDWLELDAKSILLHHYGDLDIQTGEKVFALYDAYLNQESNDYVMFLNTFLLHRKKFEQLHILCESHHLLNKRKPLINKCIDLYKQKEYLLVIQLIPTVIEGIINDICLMFGVKKHILYQSGLTQKIIFIQSKHKPFGMHNDIYSLDYFRYFFPAIRNHMSHGWADEGMEIEVLSGHLVLDLLSACDMMTKASYNMNIYIAMIKDLTDFDGKDSCKIDKYLDYIRCSLSGLTCDSFYNLDSLIKKLNNIYFTPEFSEAVLNNVSSDQLKFDELRKKLSQIYKIADHNGYNNYRDITKNLLMSIAKIFTKKKHEALELASNIKRVLGKV